MLNLKAVWILGIALLLALSAVGYEHQRAERYKTAAANLEQTVAGLATALESKDGVITQFEEAAREATRLAQGQIKALNAAAERAERYKAEIEAANRQLKLLEEADDAIPSCEALLSLDLGVCPGTVKSMRERAHGGLQGQSGDGPATDSGTAGPEVDGGLPAASEPAGEPESP